MHTNLKQLICGLCKEEQHKLYTATDGESIIAECAKCKSKNVFKPAPVKITIEHIDTCTL